MPNDKYGWKVGNMEERDYNGDIVRRCAACEWCKELEDSEGRTIYFCMDSKSGSYLEEAGLLGWCTWEEEDEE